MRNGTEKNKKNHHALKNTSKSETCVVAMCNMTDTDGCKMILSSYNLTGQAQF
jgi:hypothetical protein